MIRFLTLVAGALLTSCATAPPPLSANSPASPEAPEGARVPRPTSLAPDEATRKTSALLMAGQKEQAQWDAHGPVSGTPNETPPTNAKPETPHDHH